MARLSEVAEKLNMDVRLTKASQTGWLFIIGRSCAEAGLGGRYESILRDPSVASAAFGGDGPLAAEPG